MPTQMILMTAAFINEMSAPAARPHDPAQLQSEPVSSQTSPPRTSGKCGRSRNSPGV